MYKKIILSLLIISAIILCYHFIDRPCVYFLFAHHSRDWLVLALIADYIPAAIVALMVLFYGYTALRLLKPLHPFYLMILYFCHRFLKLRRKKQRLNKKPISSSRIDIDHKFMMVCNSIVTALFLKDVLKSIFGRYWASTFICNNLSLINNNQYGFNWFKKRLDFASFPSGHTALIFAFSTSMMLLFPRLRWLWIILALLVVFGQIGMYYHYVSDVIAGALLGSLVARCNYRYGSGINPSQTAVARSSRQVF